MPAKRKIDFSLAIGCYRANLSWPCNLFKKLLTRKIASLELRLLFRVSTHPQAF